MFRSAQEISKNEVDTFIEEMQEINKTSIEVPEPEPDAENEFIKQMKDINK